MEAVFDAFESGERRRAYVWVLVESLSGINSQFLEVENLLPEFEAAVGGGGGDGGLSKRF